MFVCIASLDLCILVMNTVHLDTMEFVFVLAIIRPHQLCWLTEKWGDSVIYCAPNVFPTTGAAAHGPDARM